MEGWIDGWIHRYFIYGIKLSKLKQIKEALLVKSQGGKIQNKNQDHGKGNKNMLDIIQ